MRKLIFVLAILLVFSGCSSANKTENKIATKTATTVAEQKIKLNSGDFLLCFYNGQNPTAKVFKINSYKH